MDNRFPDFLHIGVVQSALRVPGIEKLLCKGYPMADVVTARSPRPALQGGLAISTCVTAAVVQFAVGALLRDLMGSDRRRQSMNEC